VSEALLTIYKTTRHHTSKDHNLDTSTRKSNLIRVFDCGGESFLKLTSTEKNIFHALKECCGFHYQAKYVIYIWAYGLNSFSANRKYKT
jgi:hypothetical protein